MKEEIHIKNHNLLRLVHCQTIQNKNIWQLLKADPHLKNLNQSPTTYLQQILQFSTPKMNQFTQELMKIDIEKLLQIYEAHHIEYLTYFDDDYPEKLREIYDPPLVLFLKGNKQLLKQKSIAIVGTRDADNYAKTVLNQLVPPLIEKQFVIVSGLAIGVDSLAHQSAIKEHGQTIAVLGGGFFHIYPRRNQRLAEEIAKSHLLLSEYPPIERAAKWKFPMRNRIISGLSLGTVVIQARERSGSLITADFALDAGREVFAVPGPITNELSGGVNYLIQQGAKLVMDANDIMTELNES